MKIKNNVRPNGLDTELLRQTIEAMNEVDRTSDIDPKLLEMQMEMQRYASRMLKALYTVGPK